MTRKCVSMLMIALVFFATTAALTVPVQAQAGPLAPKSGIAVPISQAVSGTTSTGLPVSSIVGTFNITGFQVVNGALAAVGTVTVNLLNSVGQVLQTVTVANVTAPLTATGSCSILTLDIGAINLDLLGLQVSLSPIHLNITAQSGNGNLLGNLLCAVANLLNNNGGLGQIATLLNQLLGAL